VRLRDGKPIEIALEVNAFYANLPLGSVTVAVGDQVTTGQVLGLLGSTGNTGPPPALRADRLLPSIRLSVYPYSPTRSRSIASWEALWPGAPMTQPPGQAPEPHR
jgi:hypothetical protein